MIYTTFCNLSFRTNQLLPMSIQQLFSMYHLTFWLFFPCVLYAVIKQLSFCLQLGKLGQNARLFTTILNVGLAHSSSTKYQQSLVIHLKFIFAAQPPAVFLLSNQSRNFWNSSSYFCYHWCYICVNMRFLLLHLLFLSVSCFCSQLDICILWCRFKAQL